MKINFEAVKYMLIGMFLSSVFIFSTAQDDGGGYYAGNIEVERMASRIERFVRAQEDFLRSQQTLISLRSETLTNSLKNRGVGRYTYIDSLHYFDTVTAEIIERR